MDEQLHLTLEGPAGAPEPPAGLAFPQATDGGAPFDDDGRFFEPWWPGAHALVRRAGGSLGVRTEHLSDPLVVFPELRRCIEALAADNLVAEGMLLALDADGRPDARLLRRCLSGALRVHEQAQGAFVASDLAWLEGRSLVRRPYVERRTLLASIMRDSGHCVLGRGVVGEGRMLARAVASMGIGSISARRLDGRWRSGPCGDDWLRLSVGAAPVGPAPPFLVLLQRLPLDEGPPGEG